MTRKRNRRGCRRSDCCIASKRDGCAALPSISRRCQFLFFPLVFNPTSAPRPPPPPPKQISHIMPRARLQELQRAAEQKRRQKNSVSHTVVGVYWMWRSRNGKRVVIVGCQCVGVKCPATAQDSRHTVTVTCHTAVTALISTVTPSLLPENPGRSLMDRDWGVVASGNITETPFSFLRAFGSSLIQPQRAGCSRADG